jgi:hypothetical protein
MDLLPGEKLTVLLQLLEHQIGEIERREGREQQLFEWSTGLLVAAFGAVIALSDRDHPLPYPLAVKALAILLILVPTTIFAIRILGYSQRSADNAEAVERIEDLLKLFDPHYYGDRSPYPPEWQGKLAKGRRQRKTPRYYTFILMLMASCVVMTIWLIL